MTNRKQKAVRKNSNGGAKALNKAAFQIMEERAEEIANTLMDATKKGQVMSTRLLLELATGSLDAEAAAGMRPFRELLQDLAAEAQWPPEVLDAAEEAVKQ